MQLLVFTVLGAAVMVIAYAFNLAGPVVALLFLGGVFTGALLASPSRSSTGPRAPDRSGLDPSSLRCGSASSPAGATAPG